MKIRRTVLPLLLCIIAGTAHAGFRQPTYFGDFVAFVRFAVADEKCHNIPIDFDGTILQISDLAMGLILDTNPDAVAKLVAEAFTAAEMETRDDLSAFCSSVHQIYRSYDPAHLRTVGVID